MEYVCLDSVTLEVLGRIADATERIAEALESSQPVTITIDGLGASELECLVHLVTDRMGRELQQCLKI